MNVSEGRTLEIVASISMLAGPDLLDVHSDADHNRSVITMVGEVAPRDVARGAVTALDISTHSGTHPRVGVVDVVPFVALDGSTHEDAIAARDSFARFAWGELGVPCFLYGTGRTLPELRRGAFRDFAPDFGSPTPHPTAGAMCVGVRGMLIAYNVVLDGVGMDTARNIAKKLRSPHVRALAMEVSSGAQVSMNLIEPNEFGPADAVDAITKLADVKTCELVGLLPAMVLNQIPKVRWEELDLGVEKTIEWQLAARNRRMS